MRAAAAAVPLLPGQLLTGLQWRVRHAVTHGITGEYRSVFRGRGLEFDQVVRYQWGDDPRDIDWNVTARLGEPYLKRFVEERDLSIWVLFEDSPALQFGSGQRTRRETLLHTAALLMLIGAANKDRLSVLYVSPTGHWYERALPTHRDVVRVASQLLAQPPPSPDGPPRAVIPWALARRLATRRSVLLWFGAFLPADPPEAWRELQNRCQVIGVRADDIWDEALPADTRFAAYDPLSGRLTRINTASTAHRAAHRRWRDARAAHFTHLFPHAADRIAIHNEEDPFRALIAYFHRMRLGSRAAR